MRPGSLCSFVRNGQQENTSIEVTVVLGAGTIRPKIFEQNKPATTSVTRETFVCFPPRCFVKEKIIRYAKVLDSRKIILFFFSIEQQERSSPVKWRCPPLGKNNCIINWRFSFCCAALSREMLLKRYEGIENLFDFVFLGNDS